MSDENVVPVTRTRAAIYKRYSCDMQRPASLEDQERNCREHAAQQGWIVLDEYVRSDVAQSGKTLRHRHALESLLTDAEQDQPPFDVLMVDEGSRLTRKLKDALGIAELLKFHSVRLVIVNRKLDSDDPNFQTMLILNGMVDEQNSEQMRYRVRRGHIGRVLNGFSPAGRCYGYRSKAVPNANHPELQGRAAIEGYESIVYEPEAATIRRIFDLYAGGLSISDISRKLNGERVPAPGKSSIGPNYSCWQASAVKRLMQNEKYIGVRIYGKTTQPIDPKTERAKTRKNPPEKWIRKEVPSLRIVTDQVWMRVQERLKIVNEKMTRRRVGGLNRAKRRDYLFSGLLECGVCGSPMNICSSGPSYVCSSWRHRGGCTNSLWIKEERLTSQLIAALAKNILVPEVMDYFVDSVAGDFDRYVKGVPRDAEDSAEALLHREGVLTQMAANLMKAMMDPASANSSLLPRKLAEIETEIADVQARRKLLAAPKNLDDATLDIAAMVKGNISNLLEIIRQDAPKAREVLQRRIKKLQLFPTSTANGPAYEVYGEIDLFTPPTGRKNSVMLGCSSTRKAQQYTSEVDFMFRFTGLMLYTDVDVDGHPLVKPLAELLAIHPEMLHEPKSAPEWARLIMSHVPPSPKLQRRITGRYVKLHLRDREDQFVRLFEMTTIRYRGKSWYMFSKAGLTDPPSDETYISSTRSANMQTAADLQYIGIAEASTPSLP